MDHASDYRTRFPAVDDLPEFDGEQSPAFVVIFEGKIKVKSLTSGGGNGNVAEFANLVCIVVDGIANRYPGLDTTGFKP